MLLLIFIAVSNFETYCTHDTLFALCFLLSVLAISWSFLRSKLTYESKKFNCHVFQTHYKDFIKLCSDYELAEAHVSSESERADEQAPKKRR